MISLRLTNCDASLSDNGVQKDRIEQVKRSVSISIDTFSLGFARRSQVGTGFLGGKIFGNQAAGASKTGRGSPAGRITRCVTRRRRRGSPRAP